MVPPLGGAFDSVVTLVATGLPPHATATFDPPTVTPGMTGAQTVMTIQLATSGATQRGPSPARPSASRAPDWTAPAIVLLLAILPLGLMARRRSLPRLAAMVVLAFAISAAALAITGCNAGFAGPSTPAGQYTITITGTSGSLHPSTTVTVVVQ
jgi:hypothetical protein